VTIDRDDPVPSDVTVTTAPGTSAPFRSVTVPTRPPAPTWAAAGAGLGHRTDDNTISDAIHLDAMVSMGSNDCRSY
jgi:hypothetical protein